MDLAGAGSSEDVVKVGILRRLALLSLEGLWKVCCWFVDEDARRELDAAVVGVRLRFARLAFLAYCVDVCVLGRLGTCRYVLACDSVRAS